MVQQIYHFKAERPREDLVLSGVHRVLGKLAQFLTNFQLDGIRFLYRNFESNQACILNDESGLGKVAVVVAFLSAIIPSDGSKRCLIIVKDATRLANWQFHLDALTHLHVKILTAEKDIERDNVYLVTWDVLRKSPNLAKVVFNCVILDDRGDLTASKISLNFFLRNFENRISLILASSDVTLDIKQFHGLLRLCGHLDKKYQKLSVFEEKFSLPKPEGKAAADRALLEAYFLRREKIINYCREFRLRRYRHQFEDNLPLTDADISAKSLNEWKEKCLSKSSSLSSGSVRVLSSSSEKNTEELFQTYFDMKSEKLLNDEVRKINENVCKKEEKPASIVDTVEMSPLLFESDTEEITAPMCNKPIASTRTTRSMVVSPEPSCIESTETKPNVKHIGRQRFRKFGSREVIADQPILRNLRSTVRSARSKSQPPNRSIALEISRMIEQTDAEKKRQRKRSRRSAPARQQTIHIQSDDDDDIAPHEKLEYHLDTNSKVFNNMDLSPAGSSYNFNIDLLSKPLPQNSSEIHFCSPPSNQVIVISSSNECSGTVTQPTNGPAKRIVYSKNISPSPDIFENYDEYDFLCAQNRIKPSFTGFKLFGRDSKNSSQKKPTSSCLQNLEAAYRSRRAPMVETDDFEMVQIHSNLNSSQNNNKNKITNYLSSSQSIDSTQQTIVENGLRRDGIDRYPKTPKRSITTISQKSLTVSKKSPKSQRNTCTTPTGLTKWLIKKAPGDSSPNKSTKRKRLDLWFQD